MAPKGLKMAQVLTLAYDKYSNKIYINFSISFCENDPVINVIGLVIQT